MALNYIETTTFVIFIFFLLLSKSQKIAISLDSCCLS